MPIGSREAEVRELQTVLASRLFTRSPALSRLLNYLCQKYFMGEARQIKELTIAIEYFGRSDDFQSKRDPIVRVDANRLRARLKRYYRTEGKDSPVHISIPAGQYAPVFHYRTSRTTLTDTWQPEFEPDTAVETSTGAISSSPLTGPAEGPAAGESKSLDSPRSILLGILLLVILAAGLFAYFSGDQSVPADSSNGSRDGELKPSPTARTSPGSLQQGPVLRILAGGFVDQSVDRQGKIWSSDRYYTGGVAYTPLPTALLRSEDSILCRTARVGEFRYDIPLPPGVYELRLYFAEIRYGHEPEEGGESTRRFNVFANDQMILRDFDIVSDIAGMGILDVKVFNDIEPGEDGFLHLMFNSVANEALLSGLEIRPGIPGKLTPVRISTGNATYISPAQEIWEPDSFFRGGRQIGRLHPVVAARDPRLYQSERFGHFTYAIPVVKGRYRMTLKFAETYFGQKNFGGSAVGYRIFNVLCNGQTLLKDFDIAQEAGGDGMAVDKVFFVESNPQDKLLVTFQPVKNYACVNAIEVVQVE
jgi:hypothetical protein